MNELFERDLYCGAVESVFAKKDGTREECKKCWIAINISDEILAQYNGNKIKVRIEVIEDLGKDKEKLIKVSKKKRRKKW